MVLYYKFTDWNFSFLILFGIFKHITSTSSPLRKTQLVSHYRVAKGVYLIRVTTKLGIGISHCFFSNITKFLPY